MAAVDVADDIGGGGKHDVFINQTGARNRRPAGVNRALNAILPRPGDHLAGRRAVFHATQADLAEHSDTGGCKVFEIFLDHPMLDHRSARINSHPTGTES